MLRTSVFVCMRVSTLSQLPFTNAVGSLGYRSNNFIVGLTNTDPNVHAPVLWNYTLCGQYPGTVPDAATVSVQCTNAYNRGLRFRYVIVQFPLVNDSMNFCEIEVFEVGKHIHCITDHEINRNKVISRPNSLRHRFILPQTWANWSNGNIPKIRVE